MVFPEFLSRFSGRRVAPSSFCPSAMALLPARTLSPPFVLRAKATRLILLQRLRLDQTKKGYEPLSIVDMSRRLIFGPQPP